MPNVLKAERQMEVLRLLSEGCSIRSAERLTHVHRDTICRLVVRFGNACKSFMDESLRNLTLSHVECDEIWTFVQKKQGRVPVDEKHRPDVGDVYVWTAIDQETKLIPSFIVGKRSADSARRLMMDLRGRLVFPTPHASDAHGFKVAGYSHVTQISSDGFAGYPEAVDLAFGPYVKYGQLVKDYRNADQPGRYAPPEMVAAERRGIFNIQEGAEWSICTSHIERHNLTCRTFMRRFTRLSLGFSKKLENLCGAVAMFLAYYNWCWRTRYPDQSGKPGKRRPTAAMAAGVTDRLWTFADLYAAVAEKMAFSSRASET